MQRPKATSSESSQERRGDESYRPAPDPRSSRERVKGKRLSGACDEVLQTGREGSSPLLQRGKDGAEIIGLRNLREDCQGVQDHTSAGLKLLLALKSHSRACLGQDDRPTSSLGVDPALCPTPGGFRVGPRHRLLPCNKRGHLLLQPFPAPKRQVGPDSLRDRILPKDSGRGDMRILLS